MAATTTQSEPSRIAKLRSEPGMLFLVGLMIPTVLFLLRQLTNDPTLFLQTILKSAGLGSTYAIIALGFVLIFKATHVVNFAQGSLAVAGALFVSFAVADEHIPFTTIQNPLYSVGAPEWLSWGLSVIMALVFAALLGLIIERLTIRPMVGESILAVALITLGLEIVLRTMNNDTAETELRSLEIPWGVSGFQIGDALINWSIVAAIITAAICFVAVFLFYRSRTGVAMRAVALDQEAAMAQGINVGRVFAIAWAAGAVLAAIGGIFGTQPPVKQTGAVDPQTATIAFRALPAVILGGLDSAVGALAGGLLVGFAEIFAGQYAAGIQNQIGPGYSLIVPYIVMLIGLIVRPFGMFGTPEIRRV